MGKIDEAIENALANLNIDNLSVSKEQLEIIKDNLMQKNDVKELIKKFDEVKKEK